MSNYYSYTLDGIAFDDPIIGIESANRTITRNWQGTGVDNILRQSLSGTLTFTGNAYSYICSKTSSGLCENVKIEIFSQGELFYSGSILAYANRVNITKRTIECPIKDTSWSEILRNRTKQEVWLRSERTINCEPMTRLFYKLVTFSDPSGTFYAGYRLGFNVLDVLDFLAKFLTDNQVSVVSNYLQTVEYGIYKSAVLNDNTVTAPGFVTFLTDEQIWPIISFDYLFEELRKKEALYIGVEQTMSGIQLRIEPESYFFDSNIVYSNDAIPYDTNLSTDVERLLSIVKVGQEDTELPEDILPGAVPLPERRFFTWQEDVFNSCSCESDKDNELNLVSDIIIDGNQIWDALTGGDYGDRLFLIHTNFSTIPFSNAIVTLNPNNGFYYYNDRLRNPNVLPRWETFISNCLYDVRQSGIQFELVCNPLIDEFGCIQSPAIGNTPRNVKGYATWIDPQDVVIDTDNGYPTNISQPTDLTPGGSFGYKIPIEGYYIFEAQCYWDLIISGTVDNASVQISIVAFSDSTGTTEIYRKDEVLTFTNTPSLSFEVLYILSDFVLLPTGSVVVVELSSNVTNATTKSVSQRFQREFFRFSDAINCFDLPRESDSYPYVYEFETTTCNSEWQSMADNMAGKVMINGIECWISEVSQGINGNTTFKLLSNQNICCDE